MTKAERRRQRTRLEEERQTLTSELARTRTRIAQAYSGFNTVCDPDLIDSYVFEINALESRYAYLLRRVKELDGAPVSASRVRALLDAGRLAEIKPLVPECTYQYLSSLKS